LPKLTLLGAGVLWCFYRLMGRKNKKIVTVGFVALGCPKNTVDSERMLAEIAQAGLAITAEADNADVVVINTCAFIESAKTEALEAVQHSVGCKRKGTVKKVIVAGCLPQRLGRKLFLQAEGIDAIIGLGQRDAIAQIINKTLRSEGRAAYLGAPSRAVADDRVRLRTGPCHWAYLRISEGCDHRCSFCTIPAIRGRFRSKPKELVLAEAAELVSAGAVELNVIAQDTTYYGHDSKVETSLVGLLSDLEQTDGLVWVRLMYLYPGGIDERLIETIAASKKIVPYFDIPIQHINDRILRAMGRPDKKEDICRLIETLRSGIADCVLRTTLIVGFPGETAEQFAELLEFVKWAGFDALGCFKFYPESGTRAAEMPGQVADEVKEERVKELMLTQQEIAFAKNRNRIGSELTCLVDSVDGKGGAVGRFYGQAPEIDSACVIEGCSVEPGEFVDVKVVGTKDYDLIVQQIQAQGV